MLIRSLYLVGILLFICPSELAAQVIARDSAKIESIEKLFDLLDLERSNDEALESSLRDQIRASPLIGRHAQIIRDATLKHHRFAALKADLSAGYRQLYTEAEIQELIAFHQTSFGKRFTAGATAVGRLTAKLMLERNQRLVPEMTAAILAAERGSHSAP